MIWLLAILCFGAVCLVGGMIADHAGAKANSMDFDSYMVEKEGRYFAVGRGTEQRVLKEITQQEFQSRTRYEGVARFLAGVGIASIMSAGIAFIGIRLAAVRR